MNDIILINVSKRNSLFTVLIHGDENVENLIITETSCCVFIWKNNNMLLQNVPT